jgi:hypothetical protein
MIQLKPEYPCGIAIGRNSQKLMPNSLKSSLTRMLKN